MRFEFDVETLKPVIRRVVGETIAQLDAERSKLDGRIAYTEAEAAGLLGIERHVLRDCRLRGEVSASRIGKRILYSRDELMRLLVQYEIKGA